MLQQNSRSKIHVVIEGGTNAHIVYDSPSNPWPLWLCKLSLSTCSIIFEKLLKIVLYEP